MYCDATMASASPAYATGPQRQDPGPHGDTFRGAQPGSRVNFRLTAQNDFVPHVDHVQLFTIEIRILGDDVTVLDTRSVYVVVPKRLPEVLLLLKCPINLSNRLAALPLARILVLLGASTPAPSWAGSVAQIATGVRISRNTATLIDPQGRAGHGHGHGCPVR